MRDSPTHTFYENNLNENNHRPVNTCTGKVKAYDIFEGRQKKTKIEIELKDLKLLCSVT